MCKKPTLDGDRHPTCVTDDPAGFARLIAETASLIPDDEPDRWQISRKPLPVRPNLTNKSCTGVPGLCTACGIQCGDAKSTSEGD